MDMICNPVITFQCEDQVTVKLQLILVSANGTENSFLYLHWY